MTLDDLLEIIEPSMPGMEPTCSLVEAVRLAHTAIVNRLVQIRSDALVEELLIDIPAGDDIGYLPDDFISLYRRPQIVGGSFLKFFDTEPATTAGTPTGYNIIGKLIQVDPPTAEAITLKLLARIRPVAPVNMTDVFPFNGDFDQVYVDGVMAILSGGVAAMNAKQYLPGIQMQVDQLLSGANGDKEQNLADSINNR
jgi:hypothetical protein